MGRWYPLVETANKNAAETTVWCMKGGEILNLNEVQAAPVVEFLVPTYFADIISGSDPKAHATICAFLRRMLDEFSGRGFAIVPKHQYWLNIGKPSGSWPAVSYHTTGRADGWLHLKDAAVPGFFRFDVQGYAGFSSLSDLICLPPEVKESDPAELEATWTHLQETIVEAKVSKYAQDTEQIDLPEAPFVFFPLQLLSDTVSSLAWIPMLDALMIVAGECEKSGKRMVVKRHPMCKRADVGSALGSLSRSHAVHITSASIHDILPSASLVVTVNSGVGFEALLYGRRVITVGAAEYGVVAERCGTIAQLTAALSTERSVNLLEIKQFMQLYLANSVPHDEPSKIVDWVASHQAARPNTL